MIDQFVKVLFLVYMILVWVRYMKAHWNDN